MLSLLKSLDTATEGQHMANASTREVGSAHWDSGSAFSQEAEPTGQWKQAGVDVSALQYWT